MEKMVFTVILMMLFIGCGGGEDMGGLLGSHNFPQTYFKNSLKNAVVVKSYYRNKKMEEKQFGEEVKILSQETKMIMDWDYVTKIEIYSENKEKLFCRIDYSGKGDDIGKKEQLIIDKITGSGENGTLVKDDRYKNLPVEEYAFLWFNPNSGKERVTLKITLTQNLDHEIWK